MNVEAGEHASFLVQPRLDIEGHAPADRNRLRGFAEVIGPDQSLDGRMQLVATEVVALGPDWRWFFRHCDIPIGLPCQAVTQRQLVDDSVT